MQRYHNIQEVEEPPSLRYTFVDPLQSYEEISRTNYLIAAFLYENSILIENLGAEPFPYCEDDYIRHKIQKSSYFVEANSLTNQRRIEDLVVLYFDPILTPLPRKHRNYDVWLRLHKQFNYLHKQAREFRLNYFSRLWMQTHSSTNFQELFQFDPDQPHTDIFEKILNQITLETQRYLTLNKYHLIQRAHLYNHIDYGYLYWSAEAQDPDIDRKYFSEYWTHREDTEFSRYIFDYLQNPYERTDKAPAWTLEQVTDKGWDCNYPFAPFQRPRPENWIYTTCPIATRHRYTDSTFDPDSVRYGRTQGHWNSGGQRWHLGSGR